MVATTLINTGSVAAGTLVATITMGTTVTVATTLINTGSVATAVMVVIDFGTERKF